MEWQRTSASVLRLHVGDAVDLAICFVDGAVEGGTADQLCDGVSAAKRHSKCEWACMETYFGNSPGLKGVALV
jgi:hypothetical protein